MKLKLLLALFSLSFLVACDKELSCINKKNENTGAIISDLDFKCFIDLPDGNLVVKTEEEYQSFQGTLVSTAPDCGFPEVDFEKYSLVGLRTEGSGCSRSYLRSFSESENNSYLYKVTVWECGQCEPLEISNNLVIVPKLQDGWEVKFETEKK